MRLVAFWSLLILAISDAVRTVDKRQTAGCPSDEDLVHLQLAGNEPAKEKFLTVLNNLLALKVKKNCKVDRELISGLTTALLPLCTGNKLIDEATSARFASIAGLKGAADAKTSRSAKLTVGGDAETAEVLQTHIKQLAENLSKQDKLTDFDIARLNADLLYFLTKNKVLEDFASASVVILSFMPGL